MNETDLKKLIVEELGEEFAWEHDSGVEYVFNDKFNEIKVISNITLYELQKGWLVSIYIFVKDKNENNINEVEKSIYVPKECEEDIPKIVSLSI